MAPLPRETDAPPCEVLAPATQTVPLVFASPHSGAAYPDDFVLDSPLDDVTIRRSEDAFVDEIFGDAPAMGAPLLRALFPRAYVDPNREPFELDPEMFEDALPEYVNAASPRVAAGLGTVARVVCTGAEIYRRKLRFAEALERVERCYRPYHETLAALIGETRDRFGSCVLIDCHSMPSIGGPMDQDPGRRRVDFVLGDCFGTACDPAIADAVEQRLRGQGYVVTRNAPYAGGYTTRHYGRPDAGVHALQIEINRALYMDETRIERRPYLATLRAQMRGVIDTLSEVVPELVRR